MTSTAASADAPPQRERLTSVSRSRAERTDAADARLRDLLAAALPDETAGGGVAVVALGGYGRGELSAASDLDVLLLYDDERCTDVSTVAEGLWYPLWDARVPLDHSVRTLEEATEAADSDLRSALSLLDARHVAGDAALTIKLRTTLLTGWRRSARQRLPELEESCRRRADRFGELAFLLEPDLKEARGGLRDGVVLRALAATWLVEIPHAALARMRADLLDVRDVLHQVAGRKPTDRLLADLQADVAQGCGLADRDALLRHVYQLGRTMSHTADIAWRRAGRGLAARSGRRVGRTRPRPGPQLTPLAPGVAAVDGEVVLAPDSATRWGSDPLLPLRAAYAAADRGLLLAPHTAERLAASRARLPVPWPAEARRLFTALLGAGHDLLPVWETLDQAGLIGRVLPEWERVRCAPQYSPVHRHTVDRHLLETCVHAATLVRRVNRPDLLLVAALLHDIGKGEGEGHSERGAVLAGKIAAEWGFTPADVDTLVGLVRQHLLLIETATRRDLDDPATIARVAAAVGDADFLDLLAALTEADAKATGPAAWTPWRAGLLARLVVRVRSQLERGHLPVPEPLQHWQRALAERGRLDVVVEPSSPVRSDTTCLTAVAPDRVGLLATVAGVLALARLSVQSASVETVDGVGVSIWAVVGDPPDAAILRERLAAALSSSAGASDLAERLSRLDANHRSPLAPADVRVVPDASATATVVEIRAHDRPGLFHQICTAVAAADASVRSAHVSTWAGEAVDVIYLTGPDGGPLGHTALAQLLDSFATTLT
ncbi:[protein-PII] uridylyltransferase [Actinopolymorpha sp. B17G11]|uniref:[protein-PII] uridylyltransferase n=1 Tax=Actinopolymorpha sp. B17G11 TaxID=3160861 RepID=UPI0032E4B20B